MIFCYKCDIIIVRKIKNLSSQSQSGREHNSSFKQKSKKMEKIMKNSNSRKKESGYYNIWDESNEEARKREVKYRTIQVLLAIVALGITAHICFA